jgi:predicted PurR-regulated permease PerM
VPERIQTTARNQYYRRVNQTLAIILTTLAILIAIAALYSVRLIVLTTLIGVGVGVLLVPPVSILKTRYKIPRPISAAIFILSSLAVISGLTYFLVATVSNEVSPLISKLPALAKRLQTEIKSPLLAHYLQGLDFQRSFETAANTLLAGVRLGANSLAEIGFIAIIAVYLSSRPDDYLDSVVSAFPKYMRPKARGVLTECGCALRRWSWAQALAMVVVGGLASLALVIAGSHYWLFLGVTTGILEIVPYLGTIVSLAAVTLITLAADPSTLLKTEIAFLAVLALEGNVVVPLIMKDRVRLPPIHLIVLMAVLGEWFGVFGFLMAAPALAVLRILFGLILKPRLDKETVPASAIPENTAA